MVLGYLTHNIVSAKAEVIAPPKPSSQIQTIPSKTRRRRLFWLLLLANIIVWNILYGICRAEEDTPIWQAATTNSLIGELWEKCSLIPKSHRSGMVTGILFNETKPAALINNKLVHEGDAISGVKVVRIDRKKIHFAKNGWMWTQGIGQEPSSSW